MLTIFDYQHKKGYEISTVILSDTRSTKVTKYQWNMRENMSNVQLSLCPLITWPPFD